MKRSKQAAPSNKRSKRESTVVGAEHVLQLLLERRELPTFPLIVTRALRLHCHQLQLPVRSSFSLVDQENHERWLELGLDDWDIVPVALGRPRHFYEFALQRFPFGTNEEVLARAAGKNQPRTNSLHSHPCAPTSPAIAIPTQWEN